MCKKIAVIFGGDSIEHDISIITALGAMAALSVRYEVIPVYIRDGVWYTGDRLRNNEFYKNFSHKSLKRIVVIEGAIYLLKKWRVKYYVRPETCLVCGHGGLSENGALQGYLEINGMRYTCSDVVSSAICMDKERFKVMLKGLGYKHSLKYLTVDVIKGEIDYKRIVDSLGLPIIVKPSRQGSSIGINMARSIEELKEYVDIAGKYDSKVICEVGLTDFKEYNCAAMRINNELIISSIEEPLRSSDILSFDDKYVNANSSKNEIKNRLKPIINKKISTMIRSLTSRLYNDLNLMGVVRMDYLYDNQTEKLYINEVNTIPGSMAYYLFEACGMSQVELLDGIVKYSIDLKDLYEKNRIDLLSSVLKSPKMLAK